MTNYHHSNSTPFHNDEEEEFKQHSVLNEEEVMCQTVIMDGYKVTTWPAFVEDLGMVSINGKALMKLKRSTINHIGNHSYSFASGPSVAINSMVVPGGLCYCWLGQLL